MNKIQSLLGIFKTLRPSILTATLLLNGGICWGQDQISFRQLSVKDGLSQNSVVSISQDSSGYMWFATQDGLNRYDGYSFKTFPYRFVDVTRSRYSLLGKVYTDRQGKIWSLPQDKRLYLYHPYTGGFEPYGKGEDAYTIFQDESFRYWVGTYSQGLFFFDDSLPDWVPVKGLSHSNEPINDIVQLASGKLLVAGKHLLWEIDPRSRAVREITPSNEYPNFSSIGVDSSGNQWVGSYGEGLFFRGGKGNDSLCPSSFDLYTGHFPSTLNILKVFIDSRNRMWIGTYGEGLYMIDHDAKRIRHFSFEKHNPRALHYNDILSVYEDDSGIIWFGTDGAGLSYYDEYLEKFNTYTNYLTPEAINIDVVRAIEVSPEGHIWIGTSGKGLTLFEPKTNSWATFTTQNSRLPSNRIMSLHLAPNGELWIGTQGEGLVLMDQEGEFKPFHTESSPPLSARTIWDIHQDSENRMWLATRSEGLVSFDPKRGRLPPSMLDILDTLPLAYRNVRVIQEDSGGNLWLGLDQGGLIRFNPTNRTVDRFFMGGIDDSLVLDGIKTLYVKDAEEIWIGTNGQGLLHLQVPTGNYRIYHTDSGLPNNVIYAILPDSLGNLWLSSNRGITRFTPGSTFEASPIIENYDSYDGLATEFNTGAYYKDPQGNLYFGGLEGFYWFQPEAIQKNPFVPTPQITGFQVLDQPMAILPDLVLDHTENTVEFTFSGMQYALPVKSEYQYRLENYDEEWVQARNKNYARYTQLPPGHYRFQVKASNYDGIWNEVASSFAFSISPPWYATHWARLFYALLGIGLTAGVIQYLKWRWQMQMDLQQKEAEATRLKKLNQLKSQLYTHIAHEFKTPLTLIMGSMDSQLFHGAPSPQGAKRLSLLKRNTRRLTGLVDQLLQLAKLEEGKLQLSPKQGNLGLLIRLLTDSFTFQAVEKQIKFEVSIGEMQQAWYDEDAVEKIVSNLLSNAFKHGSKGGVCSLEAYEEDRHLYLQVSNTIHPSSDLFTERLFDRFYQQDGRNEGMGIGLALVKELVKLHKGDIQVASEKDTICFVVKLPINQTLLGLSSPPPSTGEEVGASVLSPSPSSKNGACALIVEDDQELRTFIRSLLESVYKVYEAKNGKEAWDLALTYIPDIIISDIKMPKPDGIELCKQLKEDPRTSHIPIVLLTGSTEEADEMKGLDAGADDYVTKPFKVDLLRNRVANLIALRKALQEKFRKEVVFTPKEIAITPTDETFFNRVQEILDMHLSDPEFNAARFCTLVGMSRMQLHRKLQTYTGLSTSAFIRSQRLQQALKIMESSDATISEVAYTVGFNTPSYFIKCFRETYGKTPAEYLKAL